MRCMVLGVSLLLALGPALRAADDDKPDKKDLTPAEEVKKLIADYQEEQQDFNKQLREAKTQEDRQKLFNEKMPETGKVATRLLELAEKNPKDEGVVPAALIWVVQQGNIQLGKSNAKALDLLIGYADDPKVADVCLNLVRSPSLKGEKLMRAVLEKGPSDEAKGKAAYSLSQYLKTVAEYAQMAKDQPEFAKQLQAAFSPENAKYVQDSDPAALAKEIEKLLETVAAKYADVKLPGNRKLGDLVQGELFEIRNLAIGKTAPEIEAEDLDGNKFKLSEYRGKVVVIDFWGNW